MLHDVGTLLDWCFVHPLHIILYFMALVVIAFFWSALKLLLKL